MRIGRSDTPPEQDLEAEYVVVGSGSAGCAIAGRLAAAGHTVLLVEAGRSDDSVLFSTPGMIAPMHMVPQLKRTLDWGYYTVPQAAALGRRIPQNRGKVVGGSSSVNGMLWVRGNRADYDGWAAEGNPGWSATDVDEAYRRIEDFEDGADAYRGSGGPVKVRRHSAPVPPTYTFLDAASATAGVKILDDYNGAEQEGVSIFQQSVADGVRQSAARAYLHDRDLPTLTVLTRTQVTRLALTGSPDRTRVGHVEAIGSDGVRRRLHASREVVVSAGVFGSAQLLMLSGLGPAAHLRELGIHVHADLPVGDNLHDHLFVPTTFSVPSAVHRGTPSYFAAGMVRRLAGRPSFLANSVFEATGFLRTSLAGPVPDLQLHVLPWSYPSPNQDEPGIPRAEPYPCLTVMSTLIRPHSRGTLRLASRDPAQAPLIDFGYLSDGRDVSVLAEGIDTIRAIMASPVWGGAVEREIHPGPRHTGADLRHEVRLRATTVYHGVGSCRMGVDERAVVDPELRVRGVEGLRVADASVMPTITGGNTNAPSIMIGNRCADLLLAAG